MQNRIAVFAFVAALGAGIAVSAAAAPPAVPAKISYQGVLLDTLGMPRTGPVSLTVRIFDGLLGSATLLYVQDFSGVALTQGVFTIEIGPTGRATAVPTDPLTTLLEDVFAGDLVSGPDRFVELTADGDTAQARIQILSAPLALRAKSAETADAATTATSVISINGLDPVALNQIFDHFDFDGGLPPNNDPSEGTGDTDGDGLANFIDPDNDNDGILDGVEVAQGSDINLVTPTVTAVNPSATDFAFPATVTVSGTNFDPGLSVVFGTQTPVPSNVTPTSFDVTVGPQAQGFFPDVQVAATNGETATASGLFEFSGFTPSVLSTSPSSADFDATVNVTVTGTNFEPGMSVTFGTESPTPTNVTPTSFDVTVGPQPGGFADVTVTRLNGVSGVGTGIFEFLSSFLHAGGPVSSFDVRADGVSVVGEHVDDDANRTWTLDALIDPPSSIAGTLDLGFDDAGKLGGVLAFTLGGVCKIGRASCRERV